MALGDISARTGLPKSAAHRMLGSLIESGFVAQKEDRGYRLTMKLVTLGFRFLGRTGLVEHCQSVLDRLAADAEELVRMAVVDGDRMVWVAKAQGARGSLVVDPVMGREVALHATATGKIWLASLPTEVAVKAVLRDGFGTPHDHGPNVIQSVEALLDELKTTRDRGYGLVWEEAEHGVAAVAVGVPSSADPDAPLVGTVSIAGPVFRLTRDKLVDAVPALRSAALELSEIGSLLRFWRDDFAIPDSRKKSTG